MTTSPGRLIVFEGPDGAGKSTITQGVHSALRLQGEPAELASFPGRHPGTLGEIVYRLHHDPAAMGVEAIAPAAVQALHIAAHLDAIARDFRPLLAAGHTVVLDRFWWSTWVYGRATDVDAEVLNALIDAELCAWADDIPEAVFLIRRPFPIDRDVDRPEWSRLADLYAELAARESSRVRVEHVDNTGEVATVIDRVLALLPTRSQKPPNL